MTDYHNPAWTKESRFRGSLDDVIIIPLIVVTLAANKILRFILSILMRLLRRCQRNSGGFYLLTRVLIRHRRLLTAQREAGGVNGRRGGR
jgi:hypothetical protein